MASVSHRRVQRRYGNYEPQRRVMYQPPKRRWLKRLVIGSTLLVILLLVAPMIIGSTALRDAPLRLALQSMHGSVHAGGAALSWFGPISYSDVEIRDAKGELILSLGKIESERSLFQIVTNLSNLGTFRIERPVVSIALRHDGSNLEDAFASPPSLQTPPPPKPETSSAPTKLPTMAIEIVDGTIKLQDLETKQNWEIDKFNFLLRTASEYALPVEMKLTGQVPHDGRTSQILVAGTPASTGGLDHFDAQIDALPLAMFRALADRFGQGLKLTGSLTTNLHCDGVGALPTGPLRVTGGVTLDAVSLTGGPLENDHFALQRIDLPCQLTYQDRKLDIEKLGLTCDVGQLTASGNVTISEDPNVDVLAQLARSTFNVDGQLDLAKLGALLPKTLHLREGTQITSGQVRLTVASKPDGGGQVWNGQIIASDLAAVHDGRRLGWDQPVDLQITAHSQAGNYWIDQFTGKASFLSLSARGSLEQFQAEAQCDLDRLMAELSQFVDLGEIKLAGRGDSRIAWQRGNAGAFQANVDGRLQSLQIAIPGRPTWQEESVVLAAATSGIVENFALGAAAAPSLRRVDTAQLTVTVDNTAARTHEQLGLRLLQPIDQIATNGRWPVEVSLQGQVGRWWPRIASWIGVDGLELAGACDIAAQAACSSTGVEIQQIKGNINGLHAWGWNSVFVDEPVVQLECSGSYDFAASRLTLNRSSLLTSTVSLQTESATVTLPGKSPLAVQGLISYQADLNRLLRWVSDPRSPPKYSLAGRLVGTADVARNGSSTRAKMNASTDDFAVYVFDETTNQRPTGKTTAAQQPQPAWYEKKLTVALDAGLDQAADTVQLSSLQIGSKALALQASGKIDALSTQQNVNLAGSIDYDWQSLGPLLKPYLGSSVTINGRQSRKFSVRGPLGSAAGPSVQNLAVNTTSNASFSNQRPTQANSPVASTDAYAFLRPLVADASLGWASADAYGMQVGPLDVDTHLENGTLTVKPIQTTIGDPRAPGKLTLTPVVHLSPGPSELILGPGPVLTNVQFSKQLNSSWVRFVAPVLGGSAQAQGTISLELDSARVPIDDPTKSDLGGRLIVQNVSVTPGPLMRPLVLITQQIEAIVKRRPPPTDLNGNPVLVKIDNQKVDFRMVDGRIYHQGLSMQIGDTIVRTRGWVAVDETIGLVAEVPLKPEWMQGNAKLASMQDQTLRIPITGTLSSPRVDARIIEQLIGATIMNVGGALETGLSKGLEKLLPPQR